MILDCVCMSANGPLVKVSQSDLSSGLLVVLLEDCWFIGGPKSQIKKPRGVGPRRPEIRQREEAIRADGPERRRSRILRVLRWRLRGKLSDLFSRATSSDVLRGEEETA